MSWKKYKEKTIFYNDTMFLSSLFTDLHNMLIDSKALLRR